jgi:hypothetical protein
LSFAKQRKRGKEAKKTGRFENIWLVLHQSVSRSRQNEICHKIANSKIAKTFLETLKCFAK